MRQLNRGAWCVSAVLAWCLLSGVAAAQPVTNPTQVLFTPSADHAQVTAYEWGYFAVGASSPIQTASIAKASLTPSGADYTFPFPRLLFGAFEHKLRACAGASCSIWADADKTTVVVPFPQSATRVQ
jgi:hypothetical protein